MLRLLMLGYIYFFAQTKQVVELVLNNNSVGYFREERGLGYFFIRNASHMAAYDRPDVMINVLERILNRQLPTPSIQVRNFTCMVYEIESIQ